MSRLFDTSIEFIKGVGTQRAQLLAKELQIKTYADLLQHYPYRYEDRTRTYKISELIPGQANVQVRGRIRTMEVQGGGRKQRLVVYFRDDTGEIELVWFRGVRWMSKRLQINGEYVAFGKPSFFNQKINMPHPEIEEAGTTSSDKGYLQPVYHTTERMKRKYLDSRTLTRIVRNLLKSTLAEVPETLPSSLIERYELLSKQRAIRHIHFPASLSMLEKAKKRLKFEELFFLQLRLFMQKQARLEKFPGKVYDQTELLQEFYEKYLPFSLTEAQKRVIKEIFQDLKSGRQMNRLLQGDVGSGKTIVAFLCMLIVLGSHAQAAMMAPTEILAEQHYRSLQTYAKGLGLRVALLTGSTKASDRKVILQYLRDGRLQILVGTHALLEERVQFKQLGLAVIDEQHRFGVAQRARLWSKNKSVYPHVLVMTATPIPRTLAMTVYGDLDNSVIDELPPGRKAIKTRHLYDSGRLKLNGFIRKQVEEGRQIYMVYPLIEESQALDLKHVMDGYESVCRAFPDLHVSIVHGKMPSADKEFEMGRFVKGETHIMVATTVIEVGVNVPNASVMVIENAERFGLAQLHQLRGRVGRGASQSYCILVTKEKLSRDARTRIATMVRSTDGFEIADVDLKLRGPGDIGGTQQSGVLELSLADLHEDGAMLREARACARELLQQDPDLSKAENQLLKYQIERHTADQLNWSRIS